MANACTAEDPGSKVIEPWADAGVGIAVLALSASATPSPSAIRIAEGAGAAEGARTAASSGDVVIAADLSWPSWV